MSVSLLLNSYALLIQLSSISLVIAIPFLLVALFFILRLFRQRAAARRVGVKTSVADAILGGLQKEVQSSLLAQEQVYERLRQSGEEAAAKVLTVMDTSVRIGDHASMLRFSVEVFPRNRASFRAETQQAISDATRQKFMPGSTVYVKFDPQNPSQVAMHRALPDAPPPPPPASAPKAAVADCPSCGAAQHVIEGLTACAYCNRPLAVP